MTKILAASLAALAFATSPVFAQSSTSPSMSGSGAATSSSTHSGQLTFVQAPQGSQVLASELMASNVLSPDGNTLGAINDILLDRGGKIQAVVFGVGGFLGIGEKNVAVPYEALQIAAMQAGASSPAASSRPTDWKSLNRITLHATRDQLRGAPDFRTQRTITTGRLFMPSDMIAR